MQGALGVLGAALAAERVAQVRVRVLLALGMLVGGKPEYGRALAAVPGAAAALMAAVRAGDDEDCRQVSAGLVAELVRRKTQPKTHRSSESVRLEGQVPAVWWQ